MAGTQTDNNILKLDLVTFNMRGFNQGWPVVNDLIREFRPNVILLQEHWLTPANLNKFDVFFEGYFCFGSSAMSNVVESGPLRGRPFGGLMCLISNDMRELTETVYCSERCAIVRVSNFLIINVYFPCAGTENRQSICDDMIAEMGVWCDRHRSCDIIVAGDFNVDLDSSDHISVAIKRFFARYDIVRCDSLCLSVKVPTYVNEALNQESTIDFIATSSPNSLLGFAVMDPSNNFSDHRPVSSTFRSSKLVHFDSKYTPQENEKYKLHALNFRWDKADIMSYYYNTGTFLQPVLTHLEQLVHNKTDLLLSDAQLYIDSIYDDLINALVLSASSCVPQCKKNFFKFWWDEELKSLKAASVTSESFWRAAGRPRSGPIFSERQSSRARYRRCLREHQQANIESYTNDLHEALLHKDGATFWKCWRSKFNVFTKCDQVDGCVDNATIAHRFMQHFSALSTSIDCEHSEKLKRDFVAQRTSYIGSPFVDEYLVDVELVDRIISQLKRGKAAGIDNISAEHLQFSHPILSSLLVKLFNLMLEYRYIPESFGRNYIVPIPKPRDWHNKALTTDDFRGIAISPLLSKVFESCLYDRFQHFFSSSDNQFGFKKGSGCNFAIYTLYNIVQRFVKDGSTVNVCSIDLSKAFDKVDHSALFIKLMKRLIPVNILDILVLWLQNSWSCVKWKSVFSPFFRLNFGVRQGSVLSPHLFAIYLDDIVNCLSFSQKPQIIIYADDILLIAPSVCELQRLLYKCEQELHWLGMMVNSKKSCCMRIGPRCDVTCANLTTINGQELPWVKEMRYLGVYITQSRCFKGDTHENKKSFFRSVNAIFGKVGRVASEEVVLQLLFSKCLPILLFGLEALPLNKSDISSLDFSFNRFIMKLFKTSDMNVVKDCQRYFGITSPSELLAKRRLKFLETYKNSCNVLCQIFAII